MRHTLLALSLIAGCAAGAAQAESATYAIDPNHTFATFEIKHFGTSTNRARFDRKEGSLQFDRAGKSGKVDLSIDVTSVNSGTAAFDKHLQGSDLFNAATYPTMRFVSDKFHFSGDKVSAVDGKLTLLGQTHPVTLKAMNFNCYENPMLKREVCGGDFEAMIDRTQWGMDYGVAVAPKDVRLLIQVEAIKQ